MNKTSLSVIILTYNEQDVIEDTLKSVEWADEIIIVDSFSTDATLALARRFTDKIYQHVFLNYAAQRNWALDTLPIAHEWVLNLDADEKISDELVQELRERFSRSLDGVDGFLIPRRTVFRGTWIKHGGHYPSYHLRVFRRSRGRCEERLYDQHFYCQGNVLTLQGDIINTISENWRIWISRHNQWARFEAQEVAGKGELPIKGKFAGSPIEKKRWLRERYYSFPILIRPFIYFFYRYFLRGGILDGYNGLLFHFFQGLWYRLNVDLRICALWIRSKRRGYSRG